MGSLDAALRTYIDERDGGTAILTHIYLLLGCALPVWYAFFAHHGGAFSARALLSALSGVAVTGVGDAAASVVGSSIGRLRWPRNKKTLEGSAAMALSVITFQAAMLHIVGFHRVGSGAWGRLVAADLAVCFLEAVTDQVDNVVLPLFH